MIEVKGRNGISAKIVLHSKSSVDGKEIVTFEVPHHRWILAEINKHRIFSNNYQSSRAVPVKRVLEFIRKSPAMPVHWGKKQSGMQAEEECHSLVDYPEKGYSLTPHNAWCKLANYVADAAERFDKAGYHKQIVNRLTEPFQMTTGVITATELDNFYYLRRHPDAQPEIQELADCMWEVLQKSNPQVLREGEWHLPYVDQSSVGSKKEYRTLEGRHLQDLEEAKRVSAASVAQVSFRKLDQSPEKVGKVWNMLVNTEQPHAVCLEHQATPIPKVHPDSRVNPEYWPEGVTHMSRNGDLWSGNFKGWIQHRQLLPNNACWNYDGDK